ncbi:hypothetical protein HYFRA_00006474 [Hymenoscyphus fraxineus]|uniref:Uncharacterized protein n=1 Tax=Hymenoscyphus fraxineus TaxID=746836 RepID=A0A9N9KQ47_9HELO|nr:hypothetical protein HYFRA_00006474 [Hymenoscyphus fraxineus]
MSWGQVSNDEIPTQSSNSDDGALEAWLQNYDAGSAAKGPVGMVPSLNSAFARPTFTPTISTSTIPASGNSSTKTLSKPKKRPAISVALNIPKLPRNTKVSYTPISGTSPTTTPNGNFRVPNTEFPSPIGTPSPFGTPRPEKHRYSRDATPSPAAPSSKAPTTVLPPSNYPSPTSYAPRETESMTEFDIAHLKSLLSTPRYSVTSHCTKDELNRAFFRLCTELNWDFFDENLAELSILRQDWEVVSRFYVDFLVGLVLDNPDYIYNNLSQDAANVLKSVGPGYNLRGEDLYAEVVHNAMSWFAPVRLEGEEWSEIDKQVMELFLKELLGDGNVLFLDRFS